MVDRFTSREEVTFPAKKVKKSTLVQLLCTYSICITHFVGKTLYKMKLIWITFPPNFSQNFYTLKPQMNFIWGMHNIFSPLSFFLFTLLFFHEVLVWVGKSFHPNIEEIVDFFYNRQIISGKAKFLFDLACKKS